MELRRDVRHLNNMIKDSGCDCSRKPKLLQPKHVSVQTDEVKDEEEFLFAGAGGSGIIRVSIVLDWRLYCCILCKSKIKNILYNFLKYVIKTSFGIVIYPTYFSLFRPLSVSIYIYIYIYLQQT
jgi:hypothetical protein